MTRELRLIKGQEDPTLWQSPWLCLLQRQKSRQGLLGNAVPDGRTERTREEDDGLRKNIQI